MPGLVRWPAPGRGHWAAFHRRIIARRGDVSATLCRNVYRDPDDARGTVIILAVARRRGRPGITGGPPGRRAATRDHAGHRLGIDLLSDREYPRRTAPPGTQRARPRT